MILVCVSPPCRDDRRGLNGALVTGSADTDLTCSHKKRWDTGSIERQPDVVRPASLKNAIEAVPLSQPCRESGLSDRSRYCILEPRRRNPASSASCPSPPQATCHRQSLAGVSVPRARPAAFLQPPVPEIRTGHRLNRQQPEGRQRPVEQGPEKQGFGDIDELSWDAPAVRRSKHIEQ